MSRTAGRRMQAWTFRSDVRRKHNAGSRSSSSCVAARGCGGGDED